MLDLPGLPDLTPTHTMTFTVKVAGAPLPPDVRLRQVEVVRQAGRIPRATLVFDDGDAAAQDFALSGGPLLMPGTGIEVLAAIPRSSSRFSGGW